MDYRAKTRELIEKFLSSTVSIALVASLVPAAGIAYAVESNSSTESTVESAATSDESSNDVTSVIPEEQQQPNDDQQPAIEDESGEQTPSTTEEAPAPVEEKQEEQQQTTDDQQQPTVVEGSGEQSATSTEGRPGSEEEKKTETPAEEKQEEQPSTEKNDEPASTGENKSGTDKPVDQSAENNQNNTNPTTNNTSSNDQSENTTEEPQQNIANTVVEGIKTLLAKSKGNNLLGADPSSTSVIRVAVEYKNIRKSDNSTIEANKRKIDNSYIINEGELLEAEIRFINDTFNGSEEDGQISLSPANGITLSNNNEAQWNATDNAYIISANISSANDGNYGSYTYVANQEDEEGVTPQTITADKVKVIENIAIEYNKIKNGDTEIDAAERLIYDSNLTTYVLSSSEEFEATLKITGEGFDGSEFGTNGLTLSQDANVTFGNVSWNNTSNTYTSTVNITGANNGQYGAIKIGTEYVRTINGISIVVDNDEPVINNLNTTTGTYGDSAKVKGITNYKIEGENESLSFGSKIEDTLGIKSVTCTTTWNTLDNTAVDGTDISIVEPVTPGSTIADITTSGLGPSAFYDGDGKLLIGKLTITVTDYVGHTASTTVSFTSESKELLDKIAIAKGPDAITVDKADASVKKISYGDQYTYSGDVIITLSDDAKSAGEFTFGSQVSTENNGIFTVVNSKTKAEGGAKESHDVAFTFRPETDNGATTTATIDKNVFSDLIFDIDNTTPKMSSPTVVTAGANNKNDKYYFNETPKFEVTLENTTTIDNINNVKVLLDNSNESLTGTWYPAEIVQGESEKTYTFTPDETSLTRITQDSDHKISFSATNIFGDNAVDKDYNTKTLVTAPQTFVYDTTKPSISVRFSGPGWVYDTANKIAGFFNRSGAIHKDESYQGPADIGAMTITVKDTTADAIDKSTLNVTGIDSVLVANDWKSVDKGYEVSIPYSRTDAGVQVGDGNNRSVTVNASDYAGNPAETYNYTPTSIEDNTDARGAEGNKFTVDTTSVQIGAISTNPEYITGADVTIDGKNYPVFRSNQVSLSIELIDNNLDTANTSFSVKPSPDGAESKNYSGNIPSEVSWKDNTGTNGRTATIVLDEPVTAQSDGSIVPLTVTVHANDLLGNKTTEAQINLDGYAGFILDSNTPSLTIKYDGTRIQHEGETVDYYKSLTAKITAIDSFFNISNSPITPSLNPDSSPTNWTISSWKELDTKKGNYEASVVFTDTNIGATNNLSVTAADKLGNDPIINNYSESEGNRASFIVDGADPVYNPRTVKVFKNDGSSPASGKKLQYNDNNNSNYMVYDESSVKVQVQITDNNLDRNATKIKVNGSDAPITWSPDNPADGTHTATITVSQSSQAQDKHDRGEIESYSIELIAVDKAQNETIVDLTSANEIGAPIVLDTFAPNMSVVYDANPAQTKTVDGVSTDFYMSDSVTATMTVFDPFFDTSVDTSKITALPADQSGKQWHVTAWDSAKENGAVVPGKYIATVKFDSPTVLNTVNDLSVIAKDMLSHTADYSYSEDKSKATAFVVDHVDPIVESVSFNTDKAPRVGSAYDVDYFDGIGPAADQKVVATITVYDGHFDTDPTISVVDAMNGTWDRKWVPEMDGDVKTGKYTTTVEYAQTPTDGVCDFKITAVDYATNTLQGNDPAAEGYNDSANYKGWSTDTSKISTFVVDTDKPQVAVSFDKAPSIEKYADESIDNKEVDYYAESEVIATITVADNNFDSKVSKVTASGTYSYLKYENEKWIEGGQEAAWHQVGNVWTAKVKYSENPANVYNTLDVQYQDKVFTAKNDISNHNGSWSYAGDSPRKYGNEDRSGSGAVGFILDATKPSISAKFTGPGGLTDKLSNDMNKIARFFKWADKSNFTESGWKNTVASKIAEQYSTGDVGLLTITVTDRHFKGQTPTKEGDQRYGLVKFLADEFQSAEGFDWQSAAWTKSAKVNGKGDYELTLTIPYVQNEDGTLSYVVGQSKTLDNLKTFAIKFKDAAGNESAEYKYDPETTGIAGAGGEGFVVDTESPVIGSYDDSSFGNKKQYNAIIAGASSLVSVYQQKSIVVSIPVNDVHLDTNDGGSYVRVSRYENGVFASEQIYQGSKWTAYNAEETVVRGGDTFTSPNGYHIDVELVDDGTTTNVVYGIEVYAQDLLGNMPSRDNHYGDTFIAVDATAPSISIEMNQNIEKTANNIDYYKQSSVTVTAKAYDASFVNDSVTQQPVPFDKALTVNTYTDNSGSTTVDNGGEWKWVKDHYELTHTYGQNNYNVTYDFGCKIGDVVSNGSIQHTYAENTAQASGERVKGAGFRVDNVTPKVDVAIDQRMVGTYENIDYYASRTGDDLTATVTVTDNNFDPANTIVDNTLAPGITKDASSGWQKWSEKWEQPDPTKPVYVATVTYHETYQDTKEAFRAYFKDNVAEGFAIYDFARNNTPYAYGDNNGTTTSTKDVLGSKVSNANFVLDTEIPKIEISFSPDYVGYVAKTSTDYFDTDKTTATITVTDRNFDDRANVSTIVDTHGFGKASTWAHTPGTMTWTATVDYTEHAVNTASDLVVSYQDKVYTANADVKDHNAQWSYSKDPRNNHAASGATQFVLDNTQPTLVVDISQPKRDEFDGLDYYSDDVNITLTVTDNNFDGATLSDSPLDFKADAPAEHGINDTGWVRNGQSNVWTRNFTVGENQSISDWADFSTNVYDLVYTASKMSLGKHVTPYNYRQANGDTAKTFVAGQEISGTARGFVVDKTAPAMDSVSIGFDPSNTGGGIQFFNRATTLYFQFSDACGLETVGLTDPDSIYVIGEGTTGFARGDVRTSSPVTVELRERNEGSRQPSLYERNVEMKVTDIVGNYRIWTIDSAGKVLFTKTGTEEGAGNVPIDGKSGNHPMGLLRDSTAPTVNLDPHSLEGTFSNQTQSVTTTVNEANFDYLQEYRGGEAVVHITKYEGNAGRAMSTREIPATAFGGGAASWSQTEAFADDGHYIVEAYFSDYANNESNRDRIGEFTIDKTAPVINSIEWSPATGKNYGGRDYFNTARSATITVTEHNWNDALESSFITTNGSIGGWSHSGDTHTCVVSFNHDGDFNLSVKITDKAGNVSETRTEPEFTVDLTAPQIRIYNSDATDDTLNGHAYNGVCLPTVSLTDTTTDGQTTFSVADTDIWSVTLAGNNSTYNARRVTPRSEDSSTNSLIVTYADFAHEIEYDDIYTIDVTMTDRAGNPAQIVVNDQVVNATTGQARAVFSINRYGSNFIVLNSELYAENEGFLKDRPLVQVQEINVSGSDDSNPAEHHGVTVTRGLDTTVLPLQDRETPDEEGFYIKSGANSYSWTVYTYNVYKPNFTSDGDYHVAVSSDDVATNKNVSTDYYDPQAKKIADAQVEFTFDGTKPIIDDVNLEDGKLYNQADYPTLTFTATDNYAVKKVEVTIDGETTEVEPEEDGASYVMPVIAKAFTGRNLSIEATDLAGNITEYAITGARVTDNIFELYWPFMVAGAAILGVGIYVFITARRRRQEELDA